MEGNVLIETKQAKHDLSASEILRKRIKVSDQGIENIIFKIAETKNDLESSYRLSYEVYVKEGYMTPSASGLRFNFYNAMPYTQTFIGKCNAEITMTITLFPDSPLGLPMDSLYKKEIDKLREKGRYVAEVGGLVSTINNQNAIMHLNKILYCYAEEYQKIDDLAITVHPKHKNFYKVVLCFEEIGEIKSYSYVNNSPAVALSLDLHKYRDYYWDYYPREPLEKDLHHFFFVKHSESISLPDKKVPLRVWDAQLFNYFFKERTDTISKADKKTKRLMEKYYNDHDFNETKAFVSANLVLQ